VPDESAINDSGSRSVRLEESFQRTAVLFDRPR
jgi:hypothetical protein